MKQFLSPGKRIDSFCCVCALAGLGLLHSNAATADVTLTSPSGNIAATISISGTGRLQYTVSYNGKLVLNASPLGISIDNNDLGLNVTSITGSVPAEQQTWYSCRGIKSTAINHYREFTLTIHRTGTGEQTSYMLWRAYDDGIAYRYCIPGTGVRNVNTEWSSWVLPAGSTCWAQANTTYYEDLYVPFNIDSSGWWCGPPFVYHSPASQNYADAYVAITEGALSGYPGMLLAPTGNRTLRGWIGTGPWPVNAGFLTPWRLMIMGAGLNDLVNSSLVENVNPAPSEALQNASWIKPGRSVWSWWKANNTLVSDQTPYMNAAVTLGFEYILWDEGWESWSSTDLNNLLQSAKSKNLGVWLWKKYSTMSTPAQRTTFYNLIDTKNAMLGKKVIVGMKLDFMNSEAQNIIQWYEAVLQETAARQFMVNFHGAGKPTGLSRTYPNEMTREGIRGLEYNSWGDYLTPQHNAALPFTRMLAGHADYTPVTFNSSRLGATSFAHQLAMAFVLTSPVTHWADNPSLYTGSTALDVIQAAPTVWDETIALPQSNIGDLAAFARRKAGKWFVAIVNGNASTARNVSFNLSFLGPGNYNAVHLADSSSTAAAFNRTTSTVTTTSTLNPWLRAGGGYVAMFTSTSPNTPVSRVAPSSLSVTVPQFQTTRKLLSVTNIGGGTMNYQVSANANWLLVTPTSGISTGESDVVTIDAPTSYLNVGAYNAVITVAATGATNPVQYIPVTLTVTAGKSPDANSDAHVDSTDFDYFSACYNGPTNPVSGNCLNLDYNSDHYVDSIDFDIFSGCYNGPTNPPGC